MHAVALGPRTVIDLCGYAAIECRVITSREGENIQVQVILLEKVPTSIRNTILYEYEMYADLRCPHMLQTLSARFIEDRSLLVLETRMCYGITLTNLMSLHLQSSIQIPESFVWVLLSSLLELFAELHDFTNRSGITRYCHFLSPHNVFISVSGELLIFPAAESFSMLLPGPVDTNVRSVFPPCFAPELASVSPRPVTPESEMWSLGKLLLDIYLLLCPSLSTMSTIWLPVDAGSHPWSWRDLSVYYSNLGNLLFKAAKYQDTSQGDSRLSLLALIIRRCLSLDPKERPSAGDILQVVPVTTSSCMRQIIDQIFAGVRSFKG